MRPILLVKNKMNKTEKLYSQILELEKKAGVILDYRFEAVKFKLADNTYYTPDFFIIYPEHFKVVETKGFLRDDAAVKFKVAAQQFPWFKWEMIRWKDREWQTIYEF